MVSLAGVSATRQIYRSREEAVNCVLLAVVLLTRQRRIWRVVSHVVGDLETAIGLQGSTNHRFVHN